MANEFKTTSQHDGITLKAFRGDRSVLLAINLEENLTPNLAGFAIKCTPPTGKAFYLPNRLSFDTSIAKTTTPEQRVWTPSNEAPFQKFRWLDYPPDLVPGEYTYEVSAMYFAAQGKLTQGATTAVSLEIIPSQPDFSNFELGFTRAYISSQAYASKFHNADIRPEPKTIDYDTAPFQAQYKWLGAHAREIIFRFLDETVKDPTLNLDVFAYDFDEPDIIHMMAQLGNRLRIILDNASLHTKQGALEPKARAILQQSAGDDNVKVGHFKRYAHDKVLIQKKGNNPIKVLTGSANFSVRGLYVQANNVMSFDDPQSATLYEQAFEEAFSDMAHFDTSPIAQKWFDENGPKIPPYSVSFAPHQSAAVSLKRVSDAIKHAQSSVLFAVMELEGGGDVLDELRNLPERTDIFSYGMTQAEKGGVTVFKPGETKGIIIPFSFLKGTVPPPFQQEYDGGKGQVIHHKFVVVDFNDVKPIVFAGSSNLAEGGEECNGDNLLEITNPEIVTAYALEALRLVDHFHFRAVWKSATTAKPLQLSSDQQKPWWHDYYVANDLKFLDRSLFTR